MCVRLFWPPVRYQDFVYALHPVWLSIKGATKAQRGLRYIGSDPGSRTEELLTLGLLHNGRS